MILKIDSDTTVNETDYFKGQPQNFVQQSIAGFGCALTHPNCPWATSFIRKTLGVHVRIIIHS
ncbi:hypothetical protein ES703_72338 [subsurface metagenome]